MNLAIIVLHVAVMDLFWGRYRLWPSLLWPLWFVAVIVVPPQHDVSISIARGFAVSEPLVFNSLPWHFFCIRHYEPSNVAFCQITLSFVTMLKIC